ncbi:lipoprotein [Streptomyces sp. LX-29]|uniref:lipoprotein n=1 Tax=Streptomyces sp. LX-29 TaxID=2900152 RepID=UPI00240E2543|nr:lipoprotein [Streptomyces sp. LX-29]WFB08924.1 lipoprotein [Streptomyces sp. LX-29]
MRGFGRAAVCAALALGVLTGCSSDSGSDDERSGKGGKAGKKDTVAAAPKAGQVGGKGSACPLPVAFGLAESWKPKAVTPPKEDEPAAFLISQGPVKLACEIDAKPAGNIGFLRVWTNDDGGTGTKPLELLKSFMADDKYHRKPEYRELKAGSLAAAEVSYLNAAPGYEDDPKRERAFAVVTPKGGVVVHLGGFDTQEHEEMLPAYELAKETMAAS